RGTARRPSGGHGGRLSARPDPRRGLALASGPAPPGAVRNRFLVPSDGGSTVPFPVGGMGAGGAVEKRPKTRVPGGDDGKRRAGSEQRNDGRGGREQGRGRGRPARRQALLHDPRPRPV